MRVMLEASDLKAALAVAAKPVKPNAIAPALACVLVEAGIDGGVRLSGCGDRVRAWRTVSSETTEAGAVLLPPSALLTFAEAATESIVLDVAAGHKATLTSGRARAKVAGLDPELFPPSGATDNPPFDVTLPSDLLVTVVDRVAFAAAKDESRPALAGVLLAFDGATLTAAAADGHRLATTRVECESDEARMIVPARPLVDAARALRGATSVRLTVDRGGSALGIESDVGCWAISLIEGQFPDFERIIPRDALLEITTSRTALLGALKLVAPVAHQDSEKVKLALNPDGIDVWATDGDDEARTQIDGAIVRGDPLVIGFNCRYLDDAVSAIESDGVTIRANGPASPVLLTATASRGESRWVAMPMNLAR